MPECDWPVTAYTNHVFNQEYQVSFNGKTNQEYQVSFNGLLRQLNYIKC